MYLYLDIETETFFNDPDLAAMPREAQIMAIPFGLAVTYVEQGGWKTWFSEDAAALWKVLTFEPVTVVGFNIQQFDLPIIYHSAGARGGAWPRVVDFFEQIKAATGRYAKLDDVARATLGRSKTADGKQAAQWLRDGEIDNVVAYCREDVEIVKALHQHALQGEPLILPRQFGKYKANETEIALWLDESGQWSRYEVRR